MNNLKHTLIIDDEESICLFLSETLERSGYSVTVCSSGEAALDLLQEHGFDLVVLDLKLGGPVDGQRILQAVRWRWPQTIVIILTAHGSLGSAVDAIEQGVDGYLLKPVRPAEVRQAIEQAFYRRHKLLETNVQPAAPDYLEGGPFQVDLERYEVRYAGKNLDLSLRDFTLLVHLMRKSPQVVDPKELVRVVRDYEPDHLHEAREIIKWFIHSLRQKVEPDPAKPRYIINVRGVGYRFDG